MPVTLFDLPASVKLTPLGAAREQAGIGPQAHRAPHLLHIALGFNQINNRVRRFGIKLGAVCIFQPAGISRKFHHCALHTKTNSKERNVAFTGIANGFYFTLDPAVTKPSGYEDTVYAAQRACRPARLDRFRLHHPHLDPDIVSDAAMGKRFVDAFIGIL